MCVRERDATNVCYEAEYLCNIIYRGIPIAVCLLSVEMSSRKRLMSLLVNDTEYNSDNSKEIQERRKYRLIFLKQNNSCGPDSEISCDIEHMSTNATFLKVG